MKRNTMKMVCNPFNNNISYYLKNELGEWDVLSGNSPLSRRYFTDTSIRERSAEILSKIDEVYNRKNKGVDILFEGSDESYEIMQKTIHKLFPDRDIRCQLRITKIAVMGKKAAGKTFLIEGLEELQGLSYSKTVEKKFIKYEDKYNHAEWYEINGIDLGRGNVEKAFETVKKLSKEGLSTVIYCISATSNRIEKIEKDLIRKIEESFAELKVMIVLTMCYKDDIQEPIDEIEKITDQVKLIPVLAKPYKTGMKDRTGNPVVIPQFGLEDVSQFVFEER